MKVVLATHKTNQWLGVNKYFYLLGKHLAKLGVEVTIIVDSMKGVKAVNQCCDITTHTVYIPPTVNTVISTMQYCHNLAKQLKDMDFDILHCGHVLPYVYLKKDIYVKTTRSRRETSYYRYHRKPVVFQPFGNELFTLAGRGMNRIYCKMAQPILRSCGENADVLLAEGEFQIDEMKQYYPKAKRIEILPVGVEPMVQKKNYAVGKRFQFLSVNSLLPYEGMDELIDAFAVLNSSCDLVIVGSGSEEARLQRRVKWLNLRVKFLKNISERDLHTLYRESDAFVCPTYETDFQMGVLEALATGLPVISRAANWLPESVIQFKNKIELADMMLMVSTTTSSTRAQNAEKGLKEVEQYSFTNIARKAVKIYESLVG